MTPANQQLKTTTCPMDCPDSCALEVEVEGGSVIAIRGRHDHPDTAGFICSKVASFNKRLSHPDRVLYPMRRRGDKGAGEFERISWPQALAEIAERFRAISKHWGAEAIVPFHYGGSNGLLTDSLLDALFFERLGASRLDLTICAAPTTAVATGMYGKMPGTGFGDYARTRCIIIWGANPKASNIHLVPYLKRSKAAGAFVATVDPRQNFSDAEVDLHLGVRPGTDLAVALAMIDLWRREEMLDLDFIQEQADGVEQVLEAAEEWSLNAAAEVAGVEADDIERLARVYAESSPAVLRCGWGLERNRNGGQAVAAVLAMPTLLGKFGVRGGGYTMSNGRAYSFDRNSVLGELDSRHRRSLNMTRLGQWLNEVENPPVKALFVYNANPMATVPDQGAIERGLRRDDLFTVVSDQVLTDTAALADLVLPAVTFLEGHDVRGGYGSYVVGGVCPVVDPAGEAWSNMRLFGQLGQAMGFEDEAFGWSDEDLLVRTAAALELASGTVEARTLQQGGLVPNHFPGGNPVQFESVFPLTPDGKVHLTPAALGPAPYHFEPVDDRFPLAMISPANSKMISSTLGEYNYPSLEITLHPDDAAARGIENGSRVRVFNDQGEVECLTRINRRVRPGVVSMPKGAWRKSSLNGATSTALCPDHVNVVGGGACFNDARVEVEPVSA